MEDKAQESGRWVAPLVQILTVTAIVLTGTYVFQHLAFALFTALLFLAYGFVSRKELGVRCHTIPTICLLLRGYIGKEHFAGGAPVYEEIVYEAKKAKLGGVMAIPEVEGFGHINTSLVYSS
jgi:hypothetical protein